MLQALDALTLKFLAQEWAQTLEGSKITKITQPSAYEFVLGFWGGKTRDKDADTLYLHLNPQMPLGVLVNNKQRQKMTLNTFSKPTSLCMLMRKHLNGSEVVTVRTLPHERVLEILLDNYNELGQRVRLVLSLEFMGKHSNMILYDEQSNTMLAVAHSVSASMSQLREVGPGLPYAPPPLQEGKLPLTDHTEADWRHMWATRPVNETPVRYLSRRLSGWGQQMLQSALDATDIFHPGSASEDVTVVTIDKLREKLVSMEAGDSLLPALLSNPGTQRAAYHYTVFARPHHSDETNPLWKSYPTVNALVYAYYIPKLSEERLARERDKLILVLNRRQDALKKRFDDLSEQNEALITKWQNQGDRLLAAYSAAEVSGNGPNGQTLITLEPYGDEEPWQIELDAALTWVENANRFYRLAKKAKARLAFKKAWAEKANNLQVYLDQLRQMILQADALDELKELDEEVNQINLASLSETEDSTADSFEKTPEKPLSQRKNPKGHKHLKSASKQKQSKAEALPSGVVSLHNSQGIEFLLGKTAKANEAIVGKLSRPNDIWLHVHQMPGSHVLIKATEQEINSVTLEEAAMLSAYYSVARQSVNVPVIYTQSRYVKKIPHSYPGHVNYREEKTIFITPDLARIEKLLL